MEHKAIGLNPKAQRIGPEGRLYQFKTEKKIMISSVSRTLSALKAFDKKMNISANNVANVETEEFKKSRATLVEGPESSVKVEITQSTDPGPTVVEVKMVKLRKKKCLM